MSVNHRVQYVDGIPNGIEVVKRDPGFVLLGPIDTMKMYTTGDCSVVVLSEGILPTYFSIPMKKNSPYSSYFSAK
jgi:hypothetical protein